jgi:UDP-N-acetylglucosamine diphosphorylase/glucosamine-1-phosphate N-acetyltransferase
MGATGLVLFDDRAARGWEPFALTRPIGELLFGSLKLVERVELALGLECLGYLTSEHLSDFAEPGGRRVLGLTDLPHDRDLIFWSSRAVPQLDVPLARLEAGTVYRIGERVAGFHLPAGRLPDPADLEEPEVARLPAPSLALQGRVLDWVWELMLETPDQVGRDLANAAPAATLPEGVHQRGDGIVSLGRDVRIEPGALLDTRDGPLRIDDGVEVRTGTRLAGPAYIGPRSRLLGGSFERISAGPYSYLRGEVVDSVVLGFSNKAHDGHIGHAYLGRWVNLGAMTTNSDLKNNYRPVRVWTPVGIRDTGHVKVGCFLGDHVKTGIGLLLGTGAVVGAGANLYGTAVPPTYVPPFSWGTGGDLGEYRLTEFLETAATVMGRRGVDLDERGRRYLQSCWRKGRGG